MNPEAARQRLDKWLWFSRLVKTRPLAVDLIIRGYVRIDGRRIEQPARLVGAGNILTIAFERRIVVLEILGCAERRGPHPEACKLYRLIEQPAN
jgi:ribosome-associated heat shock protein Hsp15